MFFKNKKYIPYGKQKIDRKDISYVVKALKSELITQGPLVDKFEKLISKKVNSKYSVAVNSATSALHIACKALDLKEGDILWTSSITFVASANCGRYCGASVDFLDIDYFNGLIDIAKLEEKLKIAKKNQKLPKIIIPVHLGGASCDMQSLDLLSKEYGFKIIEDASHAIGGQYKNRPVGNCKYSSITIFSFHPVKIITTGEGGVATTNNEKLAQKMYKLRSHGITKVEKEFTLKNVGDWYYEQQDLGFNYRMTEFQAALGISQLEKLNLIISKRKHIVDKYKSALNFKGVKLQNIDSDSISSNHLVICLFNDVNDEQHKNIFSFLRSQRIGVQLHYLPVHLQPYYRKLGFKEGDFPAAEKYSKRAISLPIFPELKHSELKYITNQISIALEKIGIKKL